MDEIVLRNRTISKINSSKDQQVVKPCAVDTTVREYPAANEDSNEPANVFSFPFEAADVPLCDQESICSQQTNHSNISCESLVRRMKLKTQLDAEEAIAKIEKENMERERALIIKRMELQNAIIDEENEIINTRADANINADLFAPPDGPSCKTNNVTMWMENQHVNEPIPNNPIADLVAAFTNAMKTVVATTTQPTANNDTNKFLSRQIAGKELPMFNGNPEDWPVFIAHYNRTDKLCNFSDEENIIRLQKCLKGKARDTVIGMLSLPENLENVMRTLESRFGRPEYIIQVLIQKAKRTASPKNEDVEGIIDFSNAVSSLVSTIENLNHIGHLYNPQLLDELVNKLPYHLKLQWGEIASQYNDDSPPLRRFKEFLFKKAEAASFITVPKTSTNNYDRNRDTRQDRNRPRAHVFTTDSVMTIVTDSGCTCCDMKNHKIINCLKFKKLNTNERWEFVKKYKLCFSCLQTGHATRECEKRKVCEENGCTSPHHPLLHNYERRYDQTVAHAVSSSNGVLLRVLPVTVIGPKTSVSTFALFDEGSTVTMIDKSLAEEIGATGEREPLHLRWTNNSSQTDYDSTRVTLNIKGSNEKDVFNINNARTVKNINLPTQHMDVNKLQSKWPHLFKERIPIKPTGKPRILIGQDNCELIIPRDVISGPSNSPFLSYSNLGWSLHGNLGSTKERVDTNFTFHTWNEENGDDILHRIVADQWKTETFGVVVPIKEKLSSQNERAMNILKNSTKQVNGRWETSLLWRDEDTRLPESKTAAFRRLRNVERQMDKDDTFSTVYCNKIEDYVSKGYATKLSEDEINKLNPKTWYLPHFGVFNPNKPGKFRLVFDAAAKSNRICLNDALLPGPDLLKPLITVLYGFREKAVGFGGDIREMFHQVNICSEDRAAQRFLWRGRDRNRNPDVYEMKAMVFGAVSSPCIAHYTKNHNASIHGEKLPNAKNAIQNKHYVDDYYDSCHSEEEAIQLIEEVTRLHKKGGFEIRSWTCSSKKVLKSIPAELRAVEEKDLSLDGNLPIERTLGMKWNPNTDKFIFPVNFHRVNPEITNGKKTPTKREVLKQVMSLFDPLGLISHFTVRAKILLQDVWRQSIGWDDELGSNTLTKWNLWISQLQSIPQFEIPRCYSLQMVNCNNIQLHVLCDASEQAFAAVAYFRIQLENEVDVSLVASKTRVSPLRTISIPRLELQAAVLGSRLCENIKNEHSLKISKTYLWSDSQTVLCWLKSDARKFKTFVANRIGEVQELTSDSSWRWIPTKENVADDATRDNVPADLSSESRWIHGPPFLKLPENQWPKEKSSVAVPADNDLEIKKDIVATAIEVQSLLDITKYSSYTKLVRTTAWITRLIINLKHRINNEPMSKGELTVTEIQNAELYWIRVSQTESFAEECHQIEKGRQISKESRLLQLSVFLSEDNLLKVGGRLEKATFLPECTKHPLVLDSKHPFTKLLIDHYHKKNGHNGQETVINELRQQYWILNIRAAVRRSWNSCQYCKNLRSIPRVPEMGNLPSCRLTPYSRPFTHTGMDYFGPLIVTVKRKKEKRYGVIFTCMTTRAIHLELAADLTSDSCIMAIRRMISRRGYPEVIYSDNGTNLKGAAVEIKEFVRNWDHNVFIRELVTKNIQWKFNPPSTPHMGGCWERLIQSVKKALKTVLNEQAPKEDTLHTVLTEAENVVNSRPLTHVSLHHEDEEALTPNHFLIGSSSAAVLGSSKLNDDICLRKKWLFAQKMVDHFWKRFIRNYLPMITLRNKWNIPQKSISNGDVVIIVDPNMPRSCWLKGVVVANHPGTDGHVRVVDIKTKMGTFRKPVTRLCVLDVRKNVEEPTVFNGGKDVRSRSNEK